jgi:nucleotide-binding universal stress UspA family protein
MRVLVATDGSDHANTATEWLRHLPFPPDREVMAITVIASSGRDATLSDPAVASARQLADETASRLLTGRTAIGRVVEGNPRDRILAAARDWGADVVVLGARGRGAAVGFLLGSVSVGVVRHAPCPVIVCKGAPRDLRTVTVALDGSEHARRAFGWLAALPLASTLRLRLVGVVESEGEPSRRGHATRRAELQEELNATAETVRSRVADIEVAVRVGAPAARIVEEAERQGSDLVVVGARGAGRSVRLLLGSVSEAVLHRARCPVLIVPRGMR